MANVKNASIREIVIDRCLQTRGRRTVQQILFLWEADEGDNATTFEGGYCRKSERKPEKLSIGLI